MGRAGALLVTCSLQPTRGSRSTPAMKRIFGKAPEKAPAPTLDTTSSRLTGRGDTCASATHACCHLRYSILLGIFVHDWFMYIKMEIGH